MLGYIKAKNGEEIEIVDAKAREDIPQLVQGTLTGIQSGVESLSYRLYKYGKVVSFFGSFTFATGGSGTKNLFTVPSEFVPAIEYEMAFFENSNDLPCAGRVRPLVNDNVLLYSTSRNPSTNARYYFSASWIVE